MSSVELSSPALPGYIPELRSRSLIPAATRESEVPLGLPVSANFAWVLTGNVVFALCQWGIIVALAKVGSTSMVGQFSLGLAIATPILMFANFDLRAVQATDASREFHFAEYLRLRFVTTACALLLIGTIACSGIYERRTAMIIAAVALAKGTETLSDVHYGLFQLNGRLDQTGRSMMLRGVFSVMAMTVALLISRDLLWACGSMTLAWLVILWCFDMRRARGLSASAKPHGESKSIGSASRLWKLARTAMPMGIVTTIAALNLQMPRYFVHARMGNHDLGVFSALAYATIAMTLVGDSLGHCVIPCLSQLYASRRLVAFRALLMKLVAIGTAIGVIGLAVARLFGERLLRAFYSPEYAAHSHVFTLLTIAAAIHFAASMLTSGITSSRHFRIQVPLYIAVTACTALGCARLVPTMGLTGAALAVVAGAVMRLILACVVVRYLLLTRSGGLWGWQS